MSSLQLYRHQAIQKLPEVNRLYRGGRGARLDEVGITREGTAKVKTIRTCVALSNRSDKCQLRPLGDLFAH